MPDAHTVFFSHKKAIYFSLEDFLFSYVNTVSNFQKVTFVYTAAATKKHRSHKKTRQLKMSL